MRMGDGPTFTIPVAFDLVEAINEVIISCDTGTFS